MVTAYIYAILLLLLLLLLTVFVLLRASGLFEPIVVHRKSPSCLTCGPTFAYKIHEGSYDQVGYLFTETSSVDSHLVQCGIHFEGFGQDKDVAPKAAVGALIKEDDDGTCRDAFKRASFHLTRLPAVNEALVVSFPHVSVFSIRIGSHRVYNHLRSYIQEHDLKITGFIELYDGEWIHYVGLLRDEDLFRRAIFSTTDDPEDEDTDHEVVGSAKPIDAESVATLESQHDIASVDPAPESSSETQGKNGEMDELEASFEKITRIPDVPTSTS